MKERELQMIVSNSLSTLKDVAQLIRLFLYLHPITGTLSKKVFSMGRVPRLLKNIMRIECLGLILAANTYYVTC